jgi:hypothetical protein
MGEGLIRFQDKINRKAMLFFEQKIEVSLKEYHDFVNYKMGTEFQDSFVALWYEKFLELRKEKEESKAFNEKLPDSRGDNKSLS